MIGLEITSNLAVAPWPTDPAPGAADIGVLTRLGLLPDGTTSGASVVALEITMPDGRHIRGETSLRLLRAGYAALVLAEEMLTP